MPPRPWHPAAGAFETRKGAAARLSDVAATVRSCIENKTRDTNEIRRDIRCRLDREQLHVDREQHQLQLQLPCNLVMLTMHFTLFNAPHTLFVF